MDDNGTPDDRHRVWVTFAYVMAGTLAAGVAQIGLNFAFGYTLEDMQAGLPPYRPQQVAILLATTQLLSYLLPGLLAARALFGSGWARRTGLSPAPEFGKLLIGIAIFVATLGMTGALAQINLSLPMANWMSEAESGVSAVLGAVILDTSWAMFGVVLVIVAVIPAIGEELVFRGLLLPGVIRRTGSVHAGVWLTALMFGLVHVQFAGLLPRVFLGGVLGFLAIASGRLWIPIAAHAVFNGAQVLAARLGALEIESPRLARPDVDSIYLLVVGGVIAAAAMHFGLPHLRPAETGPAENSGDEVPPLT